MNNLNFCFKNLSFNQILENKKFYQKKLIDNKLVGFKKIELSDSEYEKICTVVSGVDQLYWLKKKNHSTLYQPDKETLTEKSIKNFRDWCMHLDVTPVIDGMNNNLDNYGHTSYVSMNMKTFKCNKKYGKTVFLDLIKLNNSCPDYFKEKLLESKLEYHISKAKDFNIDAPKKPPVNRADYNSDLEAEIANAKIDPLSGIFYPFRTHPITKETILFWPTYLSSQLVGGSKPWFEEFKLWIKNYIDEKNNWDEWEWSKNDIIIFDNRCMLHSFTPGWKPKERIFDQIILGSSVQIFEGLR
jgi:alpha-ketoglutarate-dependent taurine dioxygenase